MFMIFALWTKPQKLLPLLFYYCRMCCKSPESESQLYGPIQLTNSNCTIWPQIQNLSKNDEFIKTSTSSAQQGSTLGSGWPGDRRDRWVRWTPGPWSDNGDDGSCNDDAVVMMVDVVETCHCGYWPLSPLALPSSSWSPPPRGPKTIVASWHCHPESFCASW